MPRTDTDLRLSFVNKCEELLRGRIDRRVFLPCYYSQPPAEQIVDRRDRHHDRCNLIYPTSFIAMSFWRTVVSSVTSPSNEVNGDISHTTVDRSDPYGQLDTSSSLLRPGLVVLADSVENVEGRGRKVWGGKEGIET